MKTGTVKFFNTQKGFGFIAYETNKNIFVHATGLIDAIKDGDSVTFEVSENKKGLNAINVRLA